MLEHYSTYIHRNPKELKPNTYMKKTYKESYMKCGSGGSGGRQVVISN